MDEKNKKKKEILSAQALSKYTQSLKGLQRLLKVLKGS